ncbi:MAG: hypothetical protein NTV49_06525, partial [Kiritimatiellaeota bacterium]|nr:hypothetical protein [Kiritimatiellota bacterium]
MDRLLGGRNPHRLRTAFLFHAFTLFLLLRLVTDMLSFNIILSPPRTTKAHLLLDGSTRHAKMAGIGCYHVRAEYRRCGMSEVMQNIGWAVVFAAVGGLAGI